METLCFSIPRGTLLRRYRMERESFAQEKRSCELAKGIGQAIMPSLPLVMEVFYKVSEEKSV